MPKATNDLNEGIISKQKMGGQWSGEVSPLLSMKKVQQKIVKT